MNVMGDVKKGSQSSRTAYGALHGELDKADIFASVTEIGRQPTPARALEWIE